MADEETADTKPAAKWLAMLKDGEDADRAYHEVCDRIDKRYSDLKQLKGESRHDREFQIFWANVETLKPAVYSRPPQPVASPRFKDRKDLPRKAADMLERAMVYDVDADDFHDTLICARDDLCINSRGVLWITDDFEMSEGGSPVPAEHLDRYDWRCEPARKWAEVGWVARRAYLDRAEVKAKFGQVPPTMKFEKVKIGDFKGEKKASVWEIWHKAENCVVVVSEDVEDVLSKAEPHIRVKGFFPCPKPAYGTLQRRTLTPVPDMVYYWDQLQEINDHTNRIAALTKSLKMRGFYPAGISDVASAIETAMKMVGDEAVLVPISSMSDLGPGAKLSDAIVWLPVIEVMQVIQGLIEQRRVLIDDVYQITGLSDIMRGATDPDETLGAQQLKSQYGSVRVRERQAEMQRLARDVIRMKAEVMAENVPIDALLEMSQVDDLPRAADIAQQVQQAQQMAQQAVMGVIQQAMQAQQQMPPQGQPTPPQGQPMQGAPM
jgi:hypothetical protein